MVLTIFHNRIVASCKISLLVNVLYVIGLFGGSLLYVGVPALSLQNIFLLPTLLINIVIIKSRKFPKEILYPLVFLAIYLIIITISTLLTPVYDSYKALLYQYHLFCIFLIPLAYPSFIKIGAVKIAQIFLIFWLIWAVMQIAVLLQLLPSSLNFLFSRNDKIDTQYGAIQISGPFSNSNDFGCIALLVLLYILYFSNRKIKNNRYFYIAGMDIFMAMSRTALIFYIILVPILQWINNRIKHLTRGFAVLLLLISGLLVTKNIWEPEIENYLYSQFGTNAITTNFNRIVSIINLLEDQPHKEHSATYRAASYKYAITYLPYQIFGSGYQNYSEFYKGGNFDDHLIWVNPHSFLIEIGIAYGLPALLCFILFLSSLVLYIYKANIPRYNRRFILIVIGYTVILSNIPSSIFLLPLFWLPMLFIYAQTIIKNDKSLSSN